MSGHHRPDPPAVPVAVPSLADHAGAWQPSGPDPGFVIDSFLNEARAAWRIRRDDRLPSASAAAAESERPGVLPVAPAAPEPDAIEALGRELLALAEVRRAGKRWGAGHWLRLRGAIEAAGAVLDAGPRPGTEGKHP